MIAVASIDITVVIVTSCVAVLSTPLTPEYVRTLVDVVVVAYVEGDSTSVTVGGGMTLGIEIGLPSSRFLPRRIVTSYRGPMPG